MSYVQTALFAVVAVVAVTTLAACGPVPKPDYREHLRETRSGSRSLR